MSKLDNFKPTSYSDNRYKTLDMEKVDDVIIGATCTHIFHLGFKYSTYVKSSKIIYKQGIETVLIKYPEDYKIRETEHDHTFLTIVLSPEDTLKFRQTPLSTQVQMQIVTADGETLYNLATELRVKNPLDVSPYKPESLLKVKDYVYEVTYDTLDYKNAEEYLKFANITVGSCSSIKADNFFGRNWDYFNNYDCEFIVRATGKYKSLGIAGGIPEVTNDFVSKFEYSDKYKVIPFFIVDGINEKGVFCSIHTVYGGDRLGAYEAIPNVTLKKEFFSSMLPRFVLDNFDSAEAAVKYLRDYCKIKVNESLAAQNYAHQFMIGDTTKVFVVEIVKNELVVIEDQALLTNFYLDTINFNEDGTVYTPFDVTLNPENLPTIKNGMNLFGKGLERYNCLVKHFATANSLDGMKAVLEEVRYGRYLEFNDTQEVTNCYPFFTEFVGTYQGYRGDAILHPYELTVDSSITDYLNADEYIQTPEGEAEYYESLLEHQKDRYKEGKQAGTTGTFNTVNSSIYNIATKTLNVIFQEDGEELEFKL